MGKEQHTPTPWCSNINGNAIAAQLVDGYIVKIAEVYVPQRSIEEHYDKRAEGAANAAFIVTACNSHDILVEACKAALNRIYSDIEKDRPATSEAAQLRAALSAAGKGG